MSRGPNSRIFSPLPRPSISRARLWFGQREHRQSDPPVSDRLNRDLLHHQREWLTPFGLLVAIVTTLVASTFQDFGMDAAVWEALYVLGGLASVTWLWITGWQAWKLRSQGGIDEIVKTLKISVVVE